jgi:hypothetical protein
MADKNTNTTGCTLALLIKEVSQRTALLTDEDRFDFVGSELTSVNRALSHIHAEGLVQGSTFCEWGSGLGGVCGVAALNGFRPLGIEIQRDFVESARALAEKLHLSMQFAQGTFLLPGDEDLTDTKTLHTELTFDHEAWNALDLAPSDCDVIFAYPWPGEESIVDGAFARHASPGALLLTFHDFDRVLVQQKRNDPQGLRTLDWI